MAVNTLHVQRLTDDDANAPLIAAPLPTATTLPTTTTTTTTLPTTTGGFQFRYVVAVLLTIGSIVDFVLRINISFALDGGMVPTDCTVGTVRCWNQTQQGYVLSSFMWGYWVTQVPGAVIGGYIGASKVFGIGLSIVIAATFLNPVVANINIWFFIALRIFIGLGQGVTFPVALNIITSWAPADEVGLFTALSTGGAYIGAVLANSISGLLASSEFLGGWPSLFYVFAGVGVIFWAIPWFVFVNDDPSRSRWVSDSEKEYLRCTTAPSKTIYVSEIPWKSIVTSVPLWSTSIIHSFSSYGSYMLLSEMPKFMVEVLDFDIKTSGFIASVPYIVYWVGYMSSGYISDKVISKGILSRTWTRKWCGVIALVIPAILLFTLSFLEDKLHILILMNIAMYFQGYANSCFYVNYMDLSPKFTGVICGIGNGLAAVTSIVGPIIVGLMINGIPLDDHSELRYKWRIAFISAALVWAVGAFQFCVFGSGEVQSWNGEGVDDNSTLEGSLHMENSSCDQLGSDYARDCSE